MKNYTVHFADVYGAGNYNSNVYSSTGQTSTGTTTTATGGTTGSGSPLANTGFDLVLGATVGSVIIFTALVIRFWKRPSRRQSPEN